MKENLTDITLLLDRTGSMSSIRSDVVGGYNTFLRTQKESPGEATFSLVQFDSNDPQEVIHDAKPIHDVGEMSEGDFLPRASTPLLDALGQAIVRTGERLSAISEDDRPSKVVFVVFTDGLENASREYSAVRVKEMVETQTDQYKWDFIFLGADINSFAQGGAMGVARGTTADVNKEVKTSAAFGMVSEKVRSYRTSGLKGDLEYSDKDRAELK